MTTLPTDNPLAAANPWTAGLGLASDLVSGLMGGTSAASGAADSGAPVQFGSISFGAGDAIGGTVSDSAAFNPRADATSTNAQPSIGSNPLSSILGGLSPPSLTSRTPGAAAPISPNTDVGGLPPVWVMGSAAAIIGALAYVYLR